MNLGQTLSSWSCFRCILVWNRIFYSKSDLIKVPEEVWWFQDTQKWINPGISSPSLSEHHFFQEKHLVLPPPCLSTQAGLRIWHNLPSLEQHKGECARNEMLPSVEGLQGEFLGPNSFFSLIFCCWDLKTCPGKTKNLLQVFDIQETQLLRERGCEHGQCALT